MRKTFLLLILFSFIVGHSFAQEKAVVKVSGEVLTPLSLSQEDLASMKRVNTSLKDRDGKSYSYSGVTLIDILKKAGLHLVKISGEKI